MRAFAQTITSAVLGVVLVTALGISVPNTGRASDEHSTVSSFYGHPWYEVEIDTDGNVAVWNESYGDYENVEYPVVGKTALAGIGWVVAGARYEIRYDLEGRTWYQSPHVDGALVAWRQANLDEYGNVLSSEIWVHDLGTGEEWIVATPDPGTFYMNIDIDGDWVVWVDDGLRVMVRNVRTMAEPVVVGDGGGSLPFPLIEDGTIVWSSSYGDPQFHDTYRVRLLAERVDDLQAEPTVLADVAYLAYRQAYDLEADMLAYVGLDDRYGQMSTVRIINMATGSEQELAIPGVDSISGVWINGRYVFTRTDGLDDQDPSTPRYSSLNAYDRLTQSAFPVLSPVILYDFDVQGQTLAWAQGNPWESAERIVHRSTLDQWLPSARVPDTRIPGPQDYYFPETGHYLQLAFKAHWERNGGLPVFGYPLTEEHQELNVDSGAWHTVQMFERQRYEWHPENIGTPYEVLLGRLGAELLTAQGRDWTSFPTADPSSPNYFPETGHAVPTAFWNYWASHGLDLGDPGVSYRESLALFGYPLSEPMVETNTDGDTILTQYFERAVFEHHPGNPPEYQVLLRRVGADKLIERGWSTPAIDNVSSFEFQARLTGSFPGPPLRLQLLLGDEPTLLTLDSLNGVDLPEAGACYFTEMEAFLFDQFSGPRESTLVIDGVDRYEFDPDWSAWVIDGVDRIWLDGELLNETLLRDGYATLASDDPDPLMQAHLIRAEQEAVRLNRGIWRACGLE